MTIVNAAGRAMTDVTDDSQLCDVTDDQKPPGTRSYLTVGLPDPHPARVQVQELQRLFFGVSLNVSLCLPAK
jgi:hypothetical protein